MTVLYLDTEFNGYGGSLISMALVEPETGDEWYEVMWTPTSDDEDIRLDPWVAANVVPKLGRPHIWYAEFWGSLNAWLKARQPPVTVIADWWADFEHLMHELNRCGPPWEVDIPMTMCLVVSGEIVSKNPHNALADAWALAEWHARQPEAAS